MSSSKKPQTAEGLLSGDHESLDQLLTSLVAALERDAEVAFAHLDLFWARLAMHIRAENLHLFPAIQGALLGDTTDVENRIPSRSEMVEAIAQLRGDHEFFMHELARAIKVMRDRKAAGGEAQSSVETVRQIIASVRQRLETHNRLEEEMVYNWPEKLIPPEELAALEESIHKELKNLPPRFLDERPRIDQP